MRTPAALLVAALATSLAPSLAGAQAFTPGNLVVMQVDVTSIDGAGTISLQEYTPTGAGVGSAIEVPGTGPGALSLPAVAGHDRHIHRSTDGRFLIFTAYGGAPGATDWSASQAFVVPRVAVLVDASGAIDATTRLTDSYDFTALRSAFTTDGQSIWLAGDNASGGTTTGGLRYTTRGSASSVNLSQVQAPGGARTPDNLRDVRAFDGQLYDCSGSDASVGKGFFAVGSGLPTSGPQMLSPRYNPDGAASTTAFYFIDADPGVPGVDVAYTVASAGGQGLHKYIKTGSSLPWTARGIVSFTGSEWITVAHQPGGPATIYIGGPDGIARIVDADPRGSSVSGAISPADYIIMPEPGLALGGFDFAPELGAPACDPDANQDGNVDQGDVDYLINVVAGGENPTNFDPDFNRDGNVDQGDVDAIIDVIAGGACP